MCVYLTGLRSPWLWELRPALVRYCRNWWVTHIPGHVSIQRHAEKCGTMWEDVFTCASDYARRALLKRLLIWVRCTWIAAGECWQKYMLTLSALMLGTICEELRWKCDVWAGCEMWHVFKVHYHYLFFPFNMETQIWDAYQWGTFAPQSKSGWEVVDMLALSAIVKVLTIFVAAPHKYCFWRNQDRRAKDIRD